MRGLIVLVPAALVLALASNALALHVCDDPPDVDLAGQAYVVVDELVLVEPAHGEV